MKSNGTADKTMSLKAVVEALEDDILFGALRPREHLVEDALIARFGVKRHIIRSALAELERMGIVRRSRNRGATVRDFLPRDVEEIHELREVLQARAAQRMPLPAAPEVIRDLVDIQRQHDAAVAEGNLRKVSQLNDMFHTRLFGACGNDHLAEAIDHYFYLMRAMRLYPLADPRLLANAQREHWEMIDAMEKGDRERLVRLCVSHIQVSKDIYLATQRWTSGPIQSEERGGRLP